MPLSRISSPSPLKRVNTKGESKRGKAPLNIESSPSLDKGGGYRGRVTNKKSKGGEVTSQIGASTQFLDLSRVRAYVVNPNFIDPSLGMNHL